METEEFFSSEQHKISITNLKTIECALGLIITDKF